MDVHDDAVNGNVAHLVDEAIDVALRWQSASGTASPAAETRLERLVEEPGGMAFGKAIVDGVLRPTDARTIAHNLELLAHNIPSGIGAGAEIRIQLSAGLAAVASGVASPVARESFFRWFAHLVFRLDVNELDACITGLLGRGGTRPVLAPVAASASGDHEASRQASRVRDLLLRDDVEAVSFRMRAVAGTWRLLDLDALVEDAASRVTPLCEVALHGERPKYLDLEVVRFDELEPTLMLFERMLDLFPDLPMGIALPANLPDSLPALQRVVKAAKARAARGGVEPSVRLWDGGGVDDERAVAEAHGWSCAAFGTEADSRAHYVRMLDATLRGELAGVLRVISATGSVFATAFAWRLARSRAVESSLEHEFRLGVGSKIVDAVKRDVGGVRVLVPVMHAGQLPLLTPYLGQRLDELEGIGLGAVQPRGSTRNRRFRAARDRFVEAVKNAGEPATATLRQQAAVRMEVADFTNPATRDWAQGVLERARDSATGEALLARSAIRTTEELDSLVAASAALGESWGQRRGSTRAAVLDSVAEVIAEWRGHLAEVAVSESGLVIEEADGEVTVAIRWARIAARNARLLDTVTGAEFAPPNLIVVVPPRTSPISALAGTVLAGIASGAAVIIKTAPETRRSAAMFVDTLAAGGVPAGLVCVIDCEEDLVHALVCDDRVDRVVHAGSRHTAKLFHSWSAERELWSTTGGRNSLIVTPSADLEAAIPDVVASAFDHAGQASTAIGTLILVGSVADSPRFLGRLADAVESMRAGSSASSATTISSLARPAGERELATLESLAEGERWRVRPRSLDEEGRRWSPGLREGVRPETLFRRPERRAPVLDVVRVDSLTEAIAVQNASGFGLSAGLYSQDAAEIDEWLEGVQAGTLCVNRPVTSIVGARAPIGGWNRSVLGTGRALGGRDIELALGSWNPVSVPAGSTVTLDGVGEAAARVISVAQPALTFEEFDWVRAGARSDEAAWQSSYSIAEVAVLSSERCVQRYRPVPVTIRLSEGTPVSKLVRVLAAAAVTHAAVAVSTAVPLHPALIDLFAEDDGTVNVAEVLVESDVRWRARVLAGEIATSRIRLIGGDATVLARVLHGQPNIAVHGGRVTTSGRIELLCFLREQSVCVGFSPSARSSPTARDLALD